MSLPPGFLDELRTRTTISSVAGKRVIWDKRKSNHVRGDMWAPCPFHHEKTPSFHVEDSKGRYYCFGCHEKGDVITFVMKTENLGFMEAVESLAAEAGMQMPARDPQAREKADRHAQLREVVEAAQNFFRLTIGTGAGADARAYLQQKRGLSPEAWARHGIGFAPAGWQGLWEHLRAKGMEEALILEAGLARASSRGGKPYDVFRNRITFPIRDPRGRVIAFGGRAMDPDDNAKYLNSPETPLFDKSRVLYNHAPAREAAGKGAPLVIAEGYMDVIALAEAGFAAAVAPLGTAVTEHHLRMAWRMADEPILALDGDTAGLRAAYRAIDLALPLLEPGKSLRFAILPGGKDPDDLIRAEGAAGMQTVLDQALPMVDVLWRRETEGRVLDSPERRAGLDKALRERTALIQDRDLRRHYERALNDKTYALFRASRGQPKARRDQAGAPRAETRSAAASLCNVADQDRLRIGIILAAVLAWPPLADEALADLETLDCGDPVHARIRDAILRAVATGAEDRGAAIAAEFGGDPLETLRGERDIAINPCVRVAGTPRAEELARLTLREEVPKLRALRGARAELEEAEQALNELADDALAWRLRDAAHHRDLAQRNAGNTEGDMDFETAPNGALVDRSERDAFAELARAIRFDKKR